MIVNKRENKSEKKKTKKKLKYVNRNQMLLDKLK